MMHKTSTVDYAIVLKGEIWAVMEKGETLLKAGDVLVQRGTNHSWSVRGSEPALVARPRGRCLRLVDERPPLKHRSA